MKTIEEWGMKVSLEKGALLYLSKCKFHPDMLRLGHNKTSILYHLAERMADMEVGEAMEDAAIFPTANRSLLRRACMILRTACIRRRAGDASPG
jgi:hypothetical protein